MTEKIMANDRICSTHFINGKPAPLEDESNPDWLPTQNLGHCKILGNPVQIAERWIRRKAREDTRSDTNENVLVSSCPLLQQPQVETNLWRVYLSYQFKFLCQWR